MSSWSDYNSSSLENDIAEVIDDFDPASPEAGIARQLMHDPNVTALTVAQAATFHRVIEPAIGRLYDRRDRQHRAAMMERAEKNG